MKCKIPAIILGGGANGLGVVRNIGRSGVTVYCVTERKEELTFSRFCKKCFVVPGVQRSEIVLRNFLTKAKKIVGEAVLFPTSDLHSLHLAQLKEELNGDYYIPLPSYQAVLTIVDKRRFYNSLSEAGIPRPFTYCPDSTNDVKRISKEIEYPVFIKPSMSQEFGFMFHTKGFVANSADELNEYYGLASKHKMDVIFQEVIPGLAGKNVYGIEGYFNKKSEPMAAFAHRRLRGWPPIFGNTCLRESISLSDIMNQYEMTSNYLKHLKYSGLMEIEWKKDPRTGQLKLLEINARQSMQNTLPTICGLNLTMMAYLDLIGKKTKHNEYYEKGIKWASFPEDLLSAAVTHTSIKEWASSLKNVRAFSYFALDDLLPWLMHGLGIKDEILKRLIS